MFFITDFEGLKYNLGLRYNLTKYKDYKYSKFCRRDCL